MLGSSKENVERSIGIRNYGIPNEYRRYVLRLIPIHQLFRIQRTCFGLDIVNVDWWICCIHTCVCVCIYMYIYIYNKYTHTRICISTYTHIYMYICMHTHVYICIRTECVNVGKKDSIHHHLLAAISETANVIDSKQQLLFT